MKQTNNALKFLLAQYRAIFKHAYVKGLATVALTAGLAVGAAQPAAATDYTATDLASGELAINNGDTLKVSADDITSWGAAVTVTSGADTVVISGGTTGGNNISGAGSLTINDSADAHAATVTISGTGTSDSTISINTIAVEDGKLVIKGNGTTAGSGGMTFTANTINLGGTNEAEATATVELGVASVTGVATLGSTNAQINLASNATVKFLASAGSGASAVLAGKLNATGGTLDFSSGDGTIETWGTADNLNITVGSGGSAGTVTATLNLTDAPDTADDESKLTINNGTIKLDANTSTAGSGAEFVISGGTLELGDAVQIIANSGSTTAASGNSVIKVANGTSADGATLMLSSTKLKTFLSSDFTSTTNKHDAGALSVTKGTLTFTDTDNITLNDFQFDSGATVVKGTIQVSSGDAGDTVITGKELTINNTLANTSKVNVEASKLTLGSETFKSSANSFGVNALKAESVTFLHDASASGDSGNAFTLKDDLTLYKSALTEIDNPYYVSGDKTANNGPEKLYIAAKGDTISQDLILNGGTDKSLTIQDGIWTYTGNMTLNSGSMQVGLGSSSYTGSPVPSESGYGVDATLNFTGTLTLNNSGAGANTITIAGNSDNSTSGGFVLGRTENGYAAKRETTATLDLRNATIKLQNEEQGTNLTTFNINEDGLLLLTESQANYLLNKYQREDNERPSTVSGAAFVLAGDGELNVDGGSLNLEVSDLVSGAAATNNQIAFNNGGFVVAQELTLTDTPADANDHTTNGLNIGDGTLVAEQVTLNNTHIPQNGTNYDNFLVKSGNIEVGERLSGYTAMTFGDGTTGASLTLGYLDENTDEYGVFDGTYTPSAAQGTVTQNLVFNGGAAGAESSLDVVYGEWQVQDITATNTVINLGGDQVALYGGGSEYKQDAEGNEYTTSLKGNNLTLNAGAVFNVYHNADATFNTLTMTGTASGTISNATVTINGSHTGAGTADESWGLATSGVTGKGLTISGRDAKLVIGSAALGSITSTLEDDGSYTYTNANQDAGGFVTVEDWGILSLGFTDANLAFDGEGLSALRQDFIAGSNGSALSNGYIDLGEAKIAGIEVSADNTISWNTLDDYKDIIADILTADLTKATLVDVNSSTNVQANVGNVRADGTTSVVKFNDSSLNTANGDGYFISNTSGNNKNAVGAEINAGTRLALNNGGKVGGDVVLNSSQHDNSKTTLDIYAAANEDGTTALTTIEGDVQAKGNNTLFTVDGDTTVQGTVDVGTLEVTRALTVNGTTEVTEGLFSLDTNDTLVYTGSLTSNGALTVTGGAYYGGDIVANKADTVFGSDLENAAELANPRDNSVEYVFAGDNTFANVTFKHDTTLERGTTTAKTVTLGQNLEVLGGGTLDAEVLQFSNSVGGYIYVGENGSGTENDLGSAGYISVDRLDLNGGTLIVDPAYGQPASMVAVGSLGDNTAVSANAGNAAGVLEGTLVGLQNSVIALGVSDNPEDERSVFEELRSTFGNYFDANGSLSAPSNGEGAVGAIAYVAKALDVSTGSKIVLNANLTSDRYLELRQRASSANPTTDEQTFLDAVNANNVYLGANTALALSDVAVNATQTDGQTTSTRAAIHFNVAAASVYGDGGKIILAGSNFDPNKDVMLFSDNGPAGQEGVEIAADGQDIQVESLSGIYVMTLEAGTTTQATKLTVSNAALQEAWYAASDPVQHLLDANVSNRPTSGVAPANSLLGERASGISYDAATNTFKDSTTGATVQGQDYVAVANADGTNYTVYHAASNALLNYTTANDNSGAIAETAARLGAYAGVAQAALAAGASTYDAISGRMGIGADASAMTFADNGQGAGLWVTPIYKNHDSDGFDAEGVDYGVDMDLYGVALGADYTLGNGLRIGAMFNIGSGDADGQGAGSLASNDFDYYGFGLYAGYTMGQFSVVGDVTYTAVDNDVEATLGSFDKVGASLDSTNLSVGVTGKYEFDFNGLYVTPHAGLRYSTIDIDDYDVDGEQVYAHFSADSIDVFSVPVGVTVATCTPTICSEEVVVGF